MVQGTTHLTSQTCDNSIHFTEQNPSLETHRHSAIQEISRILWNPKVECHVPKRPSVVPILSHWIQSTPSHPPLWDEFNIILKPMPRPQNIFPWSLLNTKKNDISNTNKTCSLFTTLAIQKKIRLFYLK